MAIKVTCIWVCELSRSNADEWHGGGAKLAGVWERSEANECIELFVFTANLSTLYFLFAFARSVWYLGRCRFCAVVSGLRMVRDTNCAPLSLRPPQFSRLQTMFLFLSMFPPRRLGLHQSAGCDKGHPAAAAAAASTASSTLHPTSTCSFFFFCGFFPFSFFCLGAIDRKH